MNRKLLLYIFACFCFFSPEAHADLTSFVADAVQAAPGQETRRGKLYVSKHGTRFEFSAKKQKVIQIIQPDKGLFRLLFPATKTYFEIETKAPRLAAGRHPKIPCQSSGKTLCIKKGNVKSGKALLEHWVIGEKGASRNITVWWDPVRHMYIRQLFPDGSKMQARMIGTMQFEGLAVEQWRMTVTFASGRRQYSYMLYAPDLGFPVMEQGSKGLVKELHNIKPHVADAALYEIPVGYKKIPVPSKIRK